MILAVGVLGERGAFPQDIVAAAEVLQVNTTGAGSLLLESSRLMRKEGHGTIVVLSSVAAQRARAANAVYCASKAGLDSLAEGLGDALAPHGVRVLLVRPGFVRTRMTEGLPVPPWPASADGRTGDRPRPRTWIGERLGAGAAPLADGCDPAAAAWPDAETPAVNQPSGLPEEFPFELIDEDDEYRSASIRRRRAQAAATRRKRLMLVDLGLGLAVALLVLLLAPGLAIVGIILILAVLGLAASMALRRLRRRRAAAEPRSLAPRRPSRHGAPGRQG